MNEALGYYVCDDRIFLSKVEACIYSSKTNKSIKWIFNNNVFDSINWTEEPDENLDFLYDQRSREIREQYDYVVLSFSGGSDSYNILQSFLRQNLHIDEVLLNVQSSTDNIKVNDSSQTASWNYGAELEITAIPKLQEIKNRSPKTVITVVDIGKQILDSYQNSKDGSWVYERQAVLNAGGAMRFNYLYFSDLRKKFDKDKKICIITGTEKPITYINDNKFYMLFSDVAANLISITPHFKEYSNTTVENFYWHPSCHKMLRKQAHVIKKWLELNPQYQDLWTPSSKEEFWKNQNLIQTILKSIIYTTWNKDWFQVDKPLSGWYCEFDSWFYRSFKHTDSYRIWKEGIDYVEKNAGEYVIYQDGIPDNLSSFTNSYYVGSIARNITSI